MKRMGIVTKIEERIDSSQSVLRRLWVYDDAGVNLCTLQRAVSTYGGYSETREERCRAERSHGDASHVAG